MELQADDESGITELSFLPDGRICVFGMSREVLEILGELALGDPVLARCYERLRASNAESTLSDRGGDDSGFVPQPTQAVLGGSESK